jgi:hypothetical protein
MSVDPSLTSPTRPPPDDTPPDRVYYSMRTGQPISVEEADALGPGMSWSEPVTKADKAKADKTIADRKAAQASIDARIKADRERKPPPNPAAR